MITLRNIINGADDDGGADAATVPFYDPCTGGRPGTAPESDAVTHGGPCLRRGAGRIPELQEDHPAERQAMIKDLSVFGLEDYTRIKSVPTSHR